MKGSCVLITPGHCASSLAIHRLKEEGYEVGPPGPSDGRHPHGQYDWPALLEPQIANDFPAYRRALRSQTRPFAFKLQSGLIHWGASAFWKLPEPCRIIVLDRDKWEDITKRIGDDGPQWLWDFSRALARFLSFYRGPVEFWTKEELCGES